MALNSHIKVPMPSEGVITRSSGKYHYVYRVLDTFRNEKGQPTNTRQQIGRFDPESGMLIPNSKYYEYYPSEPLETNLSIDSVLSIGASFLFRTLLYSMEIMSSLQTVFGVRSEEIATVASYMLCRGNVMEHIHDWCEGYTLPETPVTSQRASALFASISHAERMTFFEKWLSTQGRIGFLAYDVTSFSSYAEGISGLEWGYNRDGDKLPQMNMGCYFHEANGLPVFYVTYPGSIVDKSHLTYMMAYNDDLGIKDVGFVMDRGFCSTSNIKYMHTSGYRYVMGVETRHKATREAIASVRGSILSVSHSLGNGIYATSIRDRFYGASNELHIYFDPNLAERQRSDLYKSVENASAELAQMQQITGKDFKRFSRWFIIYKEDNGVFTFRRNDEAVDEDALNSGFFCILSNTEYDSAEVLGIYRRKDSIEKSFDDVKNHIDMKRLRTYTDATTDGKLFCSFVSLIIASKVVTVIRGIKDAKLSKPSVISELEKIKCVTVNGRIRMLNPLTKKQRTILNAFGFDEDDVLHYINSL